MLKLYILDSKNRPDDVNKQLVTLISKSELFDLLADYIVNVQTPLEAVSNSANIVAQAVALSGVIGGANSVGDLAI